MKSEMCGNQNPQFRHGESESKICKWRINLHNLQVENHNSKINHGDSIRNCLDWNKISSIVCIVIKFIICMLKMHQINLAHALSNNHHWSCNTIEFIGAFIKTNQVIQSTNAWCAAEHSDHCVYLYCDQLVIYTFREDLRTCVWLWLETCLQYIERETVYAIGKITQSVLHM